jgi:hypothetical protein
VIDYSVNPMAFPYTGLTLLLTIPASDGTTGGVWVQNQSGATVQLVLDDGAGGTPTALWLDSWDVSPGSVGTWAGPGFRGRVRVYGKAGAQIAAFRN